MKLFVYGLLKPGYYEPRTLDKAVRIAVPGDMYDLGNDAAAVHIGVSKGHIHGYLLDIPYLTLKKLEYMELPEYKLIIFPYAGHIIHAFQYTLPIPPSAKKITDFKKSLK